MTTLTIERTVGKDVETVRRRIAQFEHDVRTHPLFRMVKDGALPVSAERSLAHYLFTDSWMWPPMLVSMRDQARNAKLIQAISDNLDDECGERGESHIQLCTRFLKSLGYKPALADLAELNRTVTVSHEMSEAQIAGWLASAEMLTMPLYELANAAFCFRPGVDTKYIDVHMAVDQDHIAWLWAAVESVLEERDCVAEVLEGVGTGARATLKSLDQIYEEALGEI